MKRKLGDLMPGPHHPYAV